MRWRDWLRQAEEDAGRARRAFELGDWSLAAFMAQQAAEKALKALFLKRGEVAWGHSCLKLAEALDAPGEVLEAAKLLDRHYILSCYPNGFPEGIPSDYYTREEAERALGAVGEVLRWVKEVMGNGKD